MELYQTSRNRPKTRSDGRNNLWSFTKYLSRFFVGFIALLMLPALSSAQCASDVTAPTAVCKNITLQLNSSGQATIPTSSAVFYNYSCDLPTTSFSNVSQSFTAPQSGFITQVGAGIGLNGSGTS